MVCTLKNASFRIMVGVMVVMISFCNCAKRPRESAKEHNDDTNQVSSKIQKDYKVLFSGTWCEVQKNTEQGTEFQYSWGKSKITPGSFAIDLLATDSIFQVIDGVFDIKDLSVSINGIIFTPTWEDGRDLSGKLTITLLNNGNIILLGDDSTVKALWLKQNVEYRRVDGP